MASWESIKRFITHWNKSVIAKHANMKANVEVQVIQTPHYNYYLLHATWEQRVAERNVLVESAKCLALLS